MAFSATITRILQDFRDPATPMQIQRVLFICFRLPLTAVVLNLFSLRRLWKSLLDLRRASNKDFHKVLLSDETTKRNMRHKCDVWACLFVQTSSNIGRIISVSRFIRG